MTSYFKTLSCGLALLLASWVQADGIAAEETSKEQALKQEALGLIDQFASTLQSYLKTALSGQGVEAAIEVCSIKAPEVAANLGKESGWQIKRVSLKARNQSTAKPDQWEAQGLEYFEQQKAQEAPLLYIANTDSEFRLMKAQKVGGLCLTCHGATLSAEVQSALNKHYPQDKATGYELGDIRGAFSLRKSL